MLNYNKIESAINFDRVPKIKLAGILGIGESTFRSRLDRKNLTPDDVEKIAEFFKKPITYFFDKEEPIALEPDKKYNIKQFDCPECISKQKEINALKLALDAKEELLDFYRAKKDKDYG